MTPTDWYQFLADFWDEKGGTVGTAIFFGKQLSRHVFTCAVRRNRCCLLRGRWHKRNHVYLVFDCSRGLFWQKCFDCDCQGSSERFELPAHLLPPVGEVSDAEWVEASQASMAEAEVRPEVEQQERTEDVDPAELRRLADKALYDWKEKARVAEVAAASAQQAATAAEEAMVEWERLLAAAVEAETKAAVDEAGGRQPRQAIAGGGAGPLAAGDLGGAEERSSGDGGGEPAAATDAATGGEGSSKGAGGSEGGSCAPDQAEYCRGTTQKRAP